MRSSSLLLVLLIPLLHLDFAIKIGVHIEQVQDFTTYMECVVDALSTTEAVEVFKGAGGILHRGIVSPGQFVHVPLGAMILERTLGSNHAFGIRTMCLPPAQGRRRHPRTYE